MPRSSRLRLCLLYITMKPAIGAEASPARYRAISLLRSTLLQQKDGEEAGRPFKDMTAERFKYSKRMSRTSQNRFWERSEGTEWRSLYDWIRHMRKCPCAEICGCALSQWLMSYNTEVKHQLWVCVYQPMAEVTVSVLLQVFKDISMTERNEASILDIEAFQKLWEDVNVKEWILWNDYTINYYNMNINMFCDVDKRKKRF